MLVTNPFSPGTWTREQIDNVSRNWWVLLLTGIVGVVAGGIILFTDWTVSDLAAFVGAVLLFRGIFTMFSVPLDGSGPRLVGRARCPRSTRRARGVGVARSDAARHRVLHRLVRAVQRHHDDRRFDQRPRRPSVLGPHAGLRHPRDPVLVLAARAPGLTLVAAVLALGLWSLIYGVVQIVLAFEVKNLSARADQANQDISAVQEPRSFGAAAGH